MTDMIDKKFFQFAVSWSFGAWLLFVGVMKWVGGIEGFMGYLVSSFESTFLPVWMVTMTGWVIVVLEPIVGAWLMSQVKPFLAWIAAAKLMFMLMIGKTITKDFATVSDNWIYLLLCLVMAAMVKPSESKL